MIHTLQQGRIVHYRQGCWNILNQTQVMIVLMKSSLFHLVFFLIDI